MNSRLLFTACLVVGPLLAPVAVRAADAERHQERIANFAVEFRE